MTEGDCKFAQNDPHQVKENLTGFYLSCSSFEKCERQIELDCWHDAPHALNQRAYLQVSGPVEKQTKQIATLQNHKMYDI